MKEYASLLISNIKLRNGNRQKMLVSQFASKEVDEIKRRIENMLNIKNKKKGIIATALLVAVAGGSMFTVKTFADTSEENYNKYAPYMDEGKTAESITDITPENNSLMREEVEKIPRRNEYLGSFIFSK